MRGLDGPLMRKTFVFGDIHGCYRALLALLAKISPDPDRDTLVFLGDYIDRGPDSRPVIAELLRLKGIFRHFIALRGNHEQMFLNYLAGRGQNVFLLTGGRQTLLSYELGIANEARRRLPLEHQQFISELRTYWEDDKYIYVHAGLQPGIALPEQSADWLLWAREQFIESRHDFGKRVIFAHTPFPTPRIEANKIGIDTGAVYGGHLTCLILPEISFVSVPCD